LSKSSVGTNAMIGVLPSIAMPPNERATGRPPFPRPLLYAGCEDFFHGRETAAVDAVLIAAAVRPDRMGDAAVGDDAGVVALLVAVVDGGAGEGAVAIVLVRADVRGADVGRERGAAIGGAREVDVGLVARAAVELRRDADVERKLLRGDDALRIPRRAAVEGAAEGDRVRGVVVPRHIKLAVRTNERHRADGVAGSLRIICAGDGVRDAVI